MANLYISWREFIALCYELNEKIREEVDSIVAIARGGLAMAQVVSHLRGVRDVRSVLINSYVGDKKVDKPFIISWYTGSMEGKRVLLLDDVADSGETLEIAKAKLERERPKKLITATLHYKPTSSFKPDYFVRETNHWIIYPWEGLRWKG